MWSSIGSMNFDNRSMAFNNSPISWCSTRRLAPMDATFLDDLRFSTQITLGLSAPLDLGKNAGGRRVAVVADPLGAARR
jgi:hypothetical protein